MRNNLVLCILVLFNSFIVSAQNPTINNKSKLNNMITINPGSALQNIWYPINSTGNPQYMFIYHRLFKSRNAIRFGANFNFRDDVTTTPKPNPNLSKYSTIKFGLGYERFFYLAKSWNYFLGADLQYEEQSSSYENYSTTGAFNKSKSNSQEQTIYPFAGLQAKLNNRISILMETGFQLGVGNSESESVNQFTPGGPVNQQSAQVDSKIFKYVQPSLTINFRL